MADSFNTSSPVSKVKTKGNIELVGGIVLVTAGFFGICGKILDFFIYLDWYVRWGFMEWFGMMFVFACLTIFGIILIVLGIRSNSIVKKYYEYARYLAADPNKYISVIAVSARESAKTTSENLAKMMELGFFPDMYLDTAHNKVRYYSEDLGMNHAGASSDEYADIKCKECGAVNKVPAGASGENLGFCEYCGSPLSASAANSTENQTN